MTYPWLRWKRYVSPFDKTWLSPSYFSYDLHTHLFLELYSNVEKLCLRHRIPEGFYLFGTQLAPIDILILWVRVQGVFWIMEQRYIQRRDFPRKFIRRTPGSWQGCVADLSDRCGNLLCSCSAFLFGMLWPLGVKSLVTIYAKCYGISTLVLVFCTWKVTSSKPRENK